MEIAFSPLGSRAAREGATVFLYAMSGSLAAAAVLFAQQAASASESDRAVVLWTTAGANILASAITYLTAREIRLNDSEKKIQKADLDRAVNDASRALAGEAECREDRDKIHRKLNRQNLRIARLMERMGLEEEAGEEDSDSENTPAPDDRRTSNDPNYTGPKRRKDDRGGSGLHRTA